MDNYYNILQVDITSSNLYIKSSYDNKIKQYYILLQRYQVVL